MTAWIVALSNCWVFNKQLLLLQDWSERMNEGPKERFTLLMLSCFLLFHSKPFLTFNFFRNDIHTSCELKSY